MALIACRCPHCGGEVQIDDSLAQGFCMYCGTRIINDNVMVGHITVDKSTEFKNTLTLTKALLEVQKWDEARNKIEELLTIDVECPDAWYMKACIARVDGDQNAYSKYVSKGDVFASKTVGIFSKADIDSCYGIPVTFLVKSRDKYPAISYIINIDGMEHTITLDKTIGLSKGSHEVTCFVKGPQLVLTKPQHMTLKIEGTTTYALNYSYMWGKLYFEKQ